MDDQEGTNINPLLRGGHFYRKLECHFESTSPDRGPEVTGPFVTPSGPLAYRLMTGSRDSR